MIKELITLFRLLFNQSEPCPYWNFYSRRCTVEDGHSLGFDNIEYCKHIDAISRCLHYKEVKNAK